MGDDKMVEKNNKIITQGIVKTERAVSKDGSSYIEKTLNVYGEDFKEIKKIFDKRWD